MDINLADRLPLLMKKIAVLLFVVLAASSTARARVTFEAVTANGVQLYSGDSIPASPTINITIETNTNLTAGSDAIVLRVDGINNNLTPSTRTAGTITTSHQPIFSDGITHSLILMVKETTGDVTTFEVNHLSVDTAGTQVLSEPLNFPNPCNDATGTYISYKLSKPADITISIHDLMGNLIWKNTSVSGSEGGKATYNEIYWDVKTQSGEVLGNGLYIYLIVGDGKILSKGKIAVIK